MDSMICCFQFRISHLWCIATITTLSCVGCHGNFLKSIAGLIHQRLHKQYRLLAYKDTVYWAFLRKPEMCSSHWNEYEQKMMLNNLAISNFFFRCYSSLYTLLNDFPLLRWNLTSYTCWGIMFPISNIVAVSLTEFRSLFDVVNKRMRRKKN